MYGSTEMMKVFATCVALAVVVYVRLSFAWMRGRVLPKPALQYSVYGDLLLPTGLYDWIHVRLTNELVRNPLDSGIVVNYPDAYLQPAAYRHFLSTNTIPDGTIAFKTSGGSARITSSDLVERSCRLCPVSSDLEFANVAVKDSLQFGENIGWGFFRIKPSEPQDLRREL
ncbi:hypothetical protein PQQ88_27575 [Paraburkholderia caledonica]|jgi:hypothetical protein|uniref:hypothetical protein n=1 Tax=Paraburkholderia caledonica TaxID=134536 RepID=UPI0038BD8DC5